MIDLKMVEPKLNLSLQHGESESIHERLAKQGEELEVLEKSYGIWQSIKLNKMAMLYGMS